MKEIVALDDNPALALEGLLSHSLGYTGNT